MLGEIISAISAANIKMGEAPASIEEVVNILTTTLESTREAHELIASLNWEADELRTYLGITERAQETIQACIATISDLPDQYGAAIEQGEQYAGRLQS